jgi:hypothetical protein
MTFTGDPAVDFGSSLIAINDDFSGEDVYGTGSQYRDIQYLYVGYNPQFLFLAVTSPIEKTGDDSLGRVMVFIDNGITSGVGSIGMTNGGYTGSTNTSPTTYCNDGSSYAYGWDQSGVSVTNAPGQERKISLLVMHWRPLGDDWKAITFHQGNINQQAGVKQGSSFVRYPYQGKSASYAGRVSEIALPWATVLGHSEYTNVPAEIAVSVVIDAGISQLMPDTYDVAPNDVNGSPRVFGAASEWKRISIGP